MRTYSSIKVERAIVGGFLSLILIGTFFIWGLNLFYGQPISFIDAFFTSTSAVCVTGLSVVDTGKDLVPASQFVLLWLIQLGGLGVMTVATFLLLMFRRHIDIRQRLLFAGGMGAMDGPSGAVRLVAKIVRITVLIEGVMVLPLFIGFSRRFPPAKALWYSVFHSISAFCNAGFSLFSDSLESFSSSFLVPSAIMILIALGGLGFIVISELWDRYRYSKKLSTYSRLVLYVTSSLIVIGAVSILICEWNGAFSGMTCLEKLMNSLFSSVTPRTAGFDTVAMSSYSRIGLFFIMILMIIGASPGSTGGGIKTTTLGVLLGSTVFNSKGESTLVLWRRSISNECVLRAMMLFFVYMATIVLGVIVLNIFEPFGLFDITFEVVSALGTVGLSTGITGELSSYGKIAIVLLMFWGRVGILTFMFSVMGRGGSCDIKYPETFVPIG